jgi:hypothetical protein
VLVKVTYVVYKTILGRIMLRLQRTEERLLSPENLHRACRMLGKTEQATSVTDQPGTDKLANESGEVGGNGVHTVTKIFSQLRTICGNGDNLIAEGVNVVYVGIGDFGTHGNLGRSLHGGFKILGENSGEVCRCGVCSET